MLGIDLCKNASYLHMSFLTYRNICFVNLKSAPFENLFLRPCVLEKYVSAAQQKCGGLSCSSLNSLACLFSIICVRASLSGLVFLAEQALRACSA